MKHLILPLLLIGLANCGSEQSTTAPSILDIPVTDSRNAQTPNIWMDQDQLHITWTEENADTTTLYYTNLDVQNSRAHMVSSGADWFLNWADFSSIVSDPSDPNNIMTHWLAKSDTGTFDYDIKISNSKDGGQSWSEGKVLHNDGIAAEHGFVSVTPYNEENFFATWLDGRNTKTPDPENPDKTLPMTLRAGLINHSDYSITEFPIDAKVCDCCQTTCVKSSEGTLVAYRDRTDEEIRDITIQKFTPNGSEIIFKSNDQWKINGCPVNGPALASNKDWQAMTWYTAADSAGVYLVYGKGASFDQKIKIDNGNPLGRVDVEIANNKAYVTWLEMIDQRAEIRLKTISLHDQTVISDELISNTSPERRSGFPILKVSGQHAYITFTEVLSADHTTIRLKKIEI